jgi:hypothetical protein
MKMPSSEMLSRVVLIIADVSDERIASIIRVTRIGELGTTIAATSNRSTLLRNVGSWPRGVTSQKTAFFRELSHPACSQSMPTTLTQLYCLTNFYTAWWVCWRQHSCRFIYTNNANNIYTCPTVLTLSSRNDPAVLSGVAVEIASKQSPILHQGP